jgi:release factor glutamine methyltransferase
MTGLVEALRETERRLAGAGIESARADSRILVSQATGIARDRLVVPGNEALSPDRLAHIAELTARRITREPVALITGRREFWSLEFQVSRATLIPRPDSETLIEAALIHCTDRMDRIRVLDLGTGSGCLLLALLSELPNATGIGIDVSAEALAVAAANAAVLGLANRASFAKDDWGSSLNERFDIVGCDSERQITVVQLVCLEGAVVEHWAIGVCDRVCDHPEYLGLIGDRINPVDVLHVVVGKLTRSDTSIEVEDAECKGSTIAGP